MLGAEYELDERWTLRCGYGLNQTCVPRAVADDDLPTGDTHALAMGAGYRVTSQLSLDAALIVAYGTAQKLDNGSAPAGTTFDAISLYASMGATYRF
jgi:long-chain fatty acid transport protein